MAQGAGSSLELERFNSWLDLTASQPGLRFCPKLTSVLFFTTSGTLWRTHGRSDLMWKVRGRVDAKLCVHQEQKPTKLFSDTN